MMAEQKQADLLLAARVHAHTFTPARKAWNVEASNERRTFRLMSLPIDSQLSVTLYPQNSTIVRSEEELTEIPVVCSGVQILT